MGLGVSGLMSGLDTDSIVSQLMSLEKRPLMLLQQKEAAYQAKITALGMVKSAMSELKSAVSKLKSDEDFISYTASSSDMDIMTVSAGNDVQPGNYSVMVNSLASEQNVRSAAFAASDTAVGTGTLTIQVGGNDAVDIEIDTNNNTLSGIAQAINHADAGVTAGVLHDGTNYYLTLQGNETGASSTITLTMADDDGNNSDSTGLSSIYTDPAAQTLTETRAAADAVLTVNGITDIHRSSNKIDDLVKGLTFMLKDADPAKTVSIAASKSYSGLSKKLDGFVEKYNTFIDTVSEQTAYHGNGAATGVLFGDSTLSRITGNLSAMLYQGVDGVDSSVNSLSKLGIGVDDSGHVSLDKKQLDSAMAFHADDVSRFFTSDETGNQGIAVRMYNMFDGYLKNSTGILSAKEKGLQNSIDDIQDRMEGMNIRFDKREATLKKQFLNLEMMMTQFQDTSLRLEQQLSSIANINSFISKRG